MSDGISPLAEFVVEIGIIIIIIVIAVYVLLIRRMNASEAQQSNVSPSTPSAPTINCPYCGGPLHFGDRNITTCEYCGREVQKLSDS